MRVLHICSTLSGGGAERHLLTLCRSLRELGVEVKVAFLRDNVLGGGSLCADFERAGVPVVRLHANKQGSGGYIARFTKLASAWRPDILHSHLPKADIAGFAASIFSRPRALWIASLHDRYDQNWSGRRTVPLFRFLWARADRIVAISPAIRAWAVGPLRIEPSKVVRIDYGIDHRLWPAHARGMWDRHSAIRIGSMGRLEPRKGHQYLIRAMPEILRSYPFATLSIAGHDPDSYGATLQKEAEMHGVAHAVRLTGYASAADFFQSIDIFAFASVSEGFGQVVIEAMASALPAVTTDMSPLSDIVQDGETGLLATMGQPASFADRILQVMREPDRSAIMGAAARERVRIFYSVERMARQTLDLYQSICPSGPARAALPLLPVNSE